MYSVLLENDINIFNKNKHLFVTFWIFNLLLLFPFFAKSQNILINEFMASNATSFTDENGEYDDWVELYNAGNTPVNIGGMYITDDLTEPTLWQIPNNASQATTIPANGYLILWFDKETAQGPLHVNAKLGSSGEDIALFASNGSTLIDSRTYLDQFSDVSEGRTPNGGSNWEFYPDPTPNAPNNTDPGLLLADEPTSSKKSGLYNGTQSVTLSTPTPNGTIHYTTDGSVPTQFSPQYTGSISISQNTPLRAVTIADGYEDSNPSTFNYLIDVDHTFPVVTITAGDDLLFDPATGMYSNYQEDIEIPAHVELIETNGTVGFSQIAEIEIHGTASASIPQKSIALKAKKSLGGKEFEYEVFPDLGFDAYRSLIVRNSGQDNNLSMFRDALVTSLVRDLSDVNGIITKPDLHTQGFRPSVVYINGEYWGIYNLRERSDKRYLKVHFDLDDDEVDLIESFEEVKEGDADDWNDLLNYLNATDFTSDANFDVLKTRIDTDHFLDYNVFNVYNDNHDWPENNNRRWRERNGDGRWKYLTYDLDFTFGLFTAQGWNSGAWYNNSLARLLDEFSNSWPNNKFSTLAFRKMIQNKKWRTDFVNRMADQLNVLYNADRVNGRISTFKSVYTPEMPQHVDRWAGGFILWDDHVSKLNTFANGRVESVRGHVVSAFSDVAGTANVTLNASPTNGGQVKFSTLTLNQNQFPFDGVYFTGMDIPVEAVANSGYVFTGWSVGSLGSNSSTTLTLNGNISITANFEPVGNQQSQSISFSSIPNKQTTDGPFQVNANASSGLPVSLSITSGPASISGNTITLNGNTGTVTVVASQGGNATYLPAQNVTRTFNVTNDPGGNGPTVVLSTSSLNVDGPFTVNIDFNESVNDLTLAEVVVNNGSKSNPAGFGSSYSFTVTPNNFGIVSISIPAGSAFNGSGEPNQVSNTLEVNYDDPNGSNPTVNISTNSLNVNSSFNVNVQFSESVSGFQLNDIQVSNGSKSNSSGSGANYSFTVTPTNSGTVTISVPAGSATNNNGNANEASNTLNVNYTNPNNSGPTVNLTTGSLNVTSSFNVNIQFSEAVFNLQLSDIQVSNGTKSNPGGSGSNYNFTVTPTSDGIVTIVVPAGSANNNTGVPNQVSNTLEVNYNAPGGGCNTTENLALGRPATQSGTQQNGSADRAVDGNTDGMAFSENSVSITNWQQHAWWQIDLGTVSTIEEIKIWNREDCCEDKLQNYHILVSENPFNSTDLDATIAQSGVSDFYQTTIAQRPSTISINKTGRYVRVQLQGSAFLQLAEIEIMGCQSGNNGGQNNQTINFPNLPDRLVTDPAFALNATASSGLPVTFELVSGPAFLSGTTLNLTGSEGTVTVRARQTGNGNFNPAPSITRSFNVNPTSTNNSYCESSGTIQTSEWIQTVLLNGISNNSGIDGGYGDYTNLSTTLQAGSSYPILLTPGYSSTTYQEAWRVWIDFNQDGDFQDANELIFEGKDNVPISGNVNIPTAVNNGPTRMRVSMKWSSAANDCSVFNFGEVEDYTVNISGGTGALIGFFPSNVLSATVDKGLNVKAYPNPVEHYLVVDYTTSKDGTMNLLITDVQGLTVVEKKWEALTGGDRHIIDVSDVPAGTYSLFLKQGSQQKVIRIIKIRD